MDEVIEIAAIKIIEDKIEVYQTLIKPKSLIPEYTIKIHGITNEMVQDSPEIETILPSFLDFAQGHTWVAHNSKFDVGFIVYDMHQQNKSFFDSKVYCSCKLSRKLIKGSENHKLSTLAEFFGIDLVNHHRALDDTLACLKIFAQGLKKVKCPADLKEGYLLNILDFEKTLTSEIPEKVRGIQKYLEKQTPIEIKYKGGSLKGKFRPIRPVSLLPMPQGSVLYAHCLVSDLYKSFALKKITDFREMSEESENGN